MTPQVWIDVAVLEAMRKEIEGLRSALAEWVDAAQNGHPSPCTLGPLCPYCEIGRLRAERDKLRALLAEARGALMEVRAHMHAAGRRPERCYEMSVIDDALRSE